MGRSLVVVVSFLLVCETAAAAAPLVGTIMDTTTRKGVGGASVTVDSTGQTAIADPQGRFALDVPPGAITLDVTADGYDDVDQPIDLPEGGLTNVIVVMAHEVVIFERPSVVKTAPGQTELPREELVSVPGARSDALTALRNLPGVANVDPFTPGQYVFGMILRGMSAQDSMYMVNGIELPLLYHFFGIQSILPSEMIDNIEFIPGGFDVQYGRSTAGIVNIHTRPSRSDHWTGFAELSFINAGGFVEGPLSRRHHLKMTAAIRRSVIDALLPLAVPDSAQVSFSTAPQYYDGQLRIDWAPGDHDDLALIGFTSWDFASAGINRENVTDPNAGGGFDNRVGFTRAALSWHHNEGGVELFARAWAGDAHFRFLQGTGFFENGNGGIAGGRADTSYRVRPSIRIRAGGEFQIYHIVADARFPLPPSEGQPGQPNSTTQMAVVLNDYDMKQDTAGLYAAVDLNVGSRVKLTPGLRFDRYVSIRSQTLSPRATVSVKLTPAWTARATVGRFTRPPNGFDALGIDLRPERAIHYVGSVEYQPIFGITATASAFYNDLDDLVTFDPSLAMPSPLNGLVNRGTGHTYGIETMVRAQREHWYGWMTYTLSRSVRTDAPGRPERLFDYDQPNNLVLAVSRQIGRWRFGGRFQITTGEPTTPLLGAIYNADVDAYQPEYGQVNSVRKEAAHQLDLRVDREWQLAGWKLSAFLDVTNVYDHLRATGYNYSFNYGQRSAVTTFPVFPAIGVRGTF